MCSLLPMIFLTIGVVVDGRPTNVTENHVALKCANLSYFEAENVTNTWCCNCPAGYYMQAECQNSNYPHPTCEECEFSDNKQTFMDVNNHAPACYESRKSCDNVMNTVMKIGSTKQDNTCQCKDGYYRESDQGYCKNHTPCDKGFGIAELGSKSADTVCVKCEGNQFSDTISSTEKCKPHTECMSGQKKVFEGNSKSDVKCSDIAVTPALDPNFSRYSTTSNLVTTTAEIQTTTEVSSAPVLDPDKGKFAGWKIFLLILVSIVFVICCVLGKKFSICKRFCCVNAPETSPCIYNPQCSNGVVSIQKSPENNNKTTSPQLSHRSVDPEEESSQTPDQISGSDGIEFIDEDHESTRAPSNGDPPEKQPLLRDENIPDSFEMVDINEVSGGPSLVTKGSENINDERDDIAFQNEPKNTSSTDEVQPINGTVTELTANDRDDPSVENEARQGSYHSENENIAEENRHRNEGHPDYPELFPDWLHQEVFAFGEQRVNDTLDSHDTGKGMLCGEHGLCNEIETNDLRKLMRDKKLLPSSRINDIEDETKDRLNLRHRWMTCVAQNYGRKLTPRFLFKLTLHYEPQYIYDAMYAVFKSALNQHA